MAVHLFSFDMADNKTSFILYCDQRGIFNKLSNEQAGVLIKHIFAYVSDENPTAEFITELAFESIKQQLKRDLKSWETQQQQRKQAGLKSAEIRKRNATTFERESTTVDDRSISSTDNVNVTVNVNDTVNVIKKEKATHSFFQSEELNDVFSKWLYACANEVKMSVRKAHGQSAIEALAMKLNTMPVDKAIRQVRQSLENGWVTLRPLNEVESKLTPEDSEAIDIAILKHARYVQSDEYDPNAPENNRLRGLS